jgi:hypothetical protein
MCCSVGSKANYAAGDLRRNIFMLHDMCAGAHSAQNERETHLCCSKCAQKHTYASRDVSRNTYMLIDMCSEAHLCFSRRAQKHIYAARDVLRSTFVLLETCAETHVGCEIPGPLIKKLNTSSRKQL